MLSTGGADAVQVTACFTMQVVKLAYLVAPVIHFPWFLILALASNNLPIESKHSAVEVSVVY